MDPTLWQGYTPALMLQTTPVTTHSSPGMAQPPFWALTNSTTRSTLHPSPLLQLGWPGASPSQPPRESLRSALDFRKKQQHGVLSLRQRSTDSDTTFSEIKENVFLFNQQPVHLGIMIDPGAALHVCPL